MALVFGHLPSRFRKYVSGQAATTCNALDSVFASSWRAESNVLTLGVSGERPTLSPRLRGTSDEDYARQWVMMHISPADKSARLVISWGKYKPRRMLVRGAARNVKHTGTASVGAARAC